MASISSINILFRADLKQFSSEIQNASRELTKTGNAMKSIGKSFSTFITLPILAAGAASVKFASDFQESINKVDVAFGPAADSVKEFAKTSLDGFGIAEGSALDMAATFGDMASGMGLTTNQAAKMSTELVGLAGDLASFKNIGIDQANTALTSIFTGETESLKKLGIVMTETNLQQFAYSKGIKTQVKDLDQASKVNLRYAFVMDASKNSLGDFARTGGGAANQSRIFTESLKQLAQQFGSVILPYFTKAITYVNGIIKGFSGLSEGTKTTIVVIAGLAAVVGPLLTGLGSLLTFLPRIASSFMALNATVLANPYVAAAIAIAALGVAIYAYYQNTKAAISGQESLNNAVKKGNENAVAEVGALDKLFSAATNVKLSTNERKKAVDELQALYPAYFKNLDDEAFKNGTAKKSYDELREAIFNKSRAIAIDGEIQNRANARIQKELELRDKIAKSEAKIAEIKAGPDTRVLSRASQSGGTIGTGTIEIIISKSDALKKQQEFLKIFQNDLKKYNDENLKADSVLFSAKEEYLNKTGKLQDNEIATLNDVNVGTSAIAETIKTAAPGTIAFYEAQIAALQKIQKEQLTSNAAIQQYDILIASVQKKIDALESKTIKLPKPPVDLSAPSAPTAFSLDNLKQIKSSYEAARNEFSTTSAEYESFAKVINDTQIKINAIEGVEETKTQIEDVTSKLQSFSEGVASAMSNAVASFAEGFGQVVAQFAAGGNFLEGVAGLFLSTLGGLMVQVGKIAIQTGIAILGIKKALQSLNPYVAIAAGVALIALGSLVTSNLKSAGSFANGGMVGGSSYSGDKLFARVNSGEMILNSKQQRNLGNMINPAASGAVNVLLGGGFEVDGSKLRLVLDRTDTKKNRIS
jgi:hypothetical protein